MINMEDWGTPEERSRIRELYDELPWCGCGNQPERGIIREVLERAQNMSIGRPSFYTAFHDAAPRWAEFAALVADDAGLLDHDASIGYPFLTDDGRLMLRFLEALGDGDKPSWLHGMSTEEATADALKRIATLEQELRDIRRAFKL